MSIPVINEQEEELLDKFAQAAMEAIIHKISFTPDPGTVNTVCKEAYNYALAMISNRRNVHKQIKR